MSRTARALVALSLLAAAGAAAAAPSSAVPLPPPPPGATLLRPPARPWHLGATVGYDARLGNGGDGAAVLAVGVATPWRTTAAGVALGWALELRSFLPSKTDAGLAYGSTGLELGPALRASVPLGRSGAALRTQLGAGAVTRWTWAETDTRFVGRQTGTGTETTGVVRAGLALDWAVRPRLTVVVEPLSLGFDLRGNADWILSAGATYQL